MHDEQEFLQAIRERPHDEAIRLVFADWLEEAGDPRAEFLRVDAQLARSHQGDPEYAELLLRWRDLRDGLPSEWQRLFSRSVVQNCGLKLVPCPQKWNDLNATPHAAVRHCWACDKPVYYCQSLDELHAHAQLGDCVAVDHHVPFLAQDLLPAREENLEATGAGPRTQPPLASRPPPLAAGLGFVFQV
jgi:uncharacterized protein (TIGR02996 family)